MIGWAKSLNMPIDSVLYDISYRNAMMYARALPHYDDEKEEEWDASIDASDPNNFQSVNDEETIYRIR